jgi:hypothetical protein
MRYQREKSRRDIFMYVVRMFHVVFSHDTLQLNDERRALALQVCGSARAQQEVQYIYVRLR